MDVSTSILEKTVEVKSIKLNCKAGKKQFPIGLNQKKINKSNKNRKKKRRRPRNRPYSAKNFLGRPKINAPANTTQFLCADKEYYSENCNPALASAGHGSSSYSESESSLIHYKDNAINSSYESTALDDDSFFTEELNQMHESFQIELLSSESIETLTAKCIELESAVHNLRYLLHKETDKRKNIEELIYLLELNKKLLHENNNLLQMKAEQTVEENDLSGNLHGININKPDMCEVDDINRIFHSF